MDLKQTNRENPKALFDQLSDTFSCTGTFRKPGENYVDYLLGSLTPSWKKNLNQWPKLARNQKWNSNMHEDFLPMFTPYSERQLSLETHALEFVIQPIPSP